MDRCRATSSSCMRTFTFAMMSLLFLDGCVTGAPQTVSEPVTPGKAASGYFVALAAESSSKETLVVYDGLQDAIHGFNRRLAEKTGQLSAYALAYERDGYTRLADANNEIECDLSKCLVKLVSKTLVADLKDEDALAAKLTKAFVDKGLVPSRTGAGEEQLRTYVLGNKAGMHISCAEKGLATLTTYRCDFALATGKATASATEAALDGAPRGRLVSCALSPGTVRNAEEAKAELENGELLELTSAAGKSVGYLRLARQGDKVEFEDIYLCGDLSHDHFVIEGPAKSPKAWLPDSPKVGATVEHLESVHEDEAHMAASATVTEVAKDHYLLEVHFKLGREEVASGEVYGEDRFVIKLQKIWIK